MLMLIYKADADHDQRRAEWHSVVNADGEDYSLAGREINLETMDMPLREQVNFYMAPKTIEIGG